MQQTLQQITEQTQLVVAAIGGIVALANCFFGYKLRRVWIALSGFFIGLAIGCGLSLLFGANAGVALLIGLAAGVLVGLVAMKLYKVGIFLLCFGAGYLFFAGLVPIDWLAWVLGVAGGVLVGVLAVRFFRTAVILSTGIGYGMSAAQMLLSVFGVTSLAIVLPAGIVLALAGVVTQFATTAHDKDEG